ncbi:MAG TPA: hypothetical protein PK447_02400 [Ignavibacteria bacterium]|nr:hypothetical protein [Ignavibacteria bacterium]
MKGVNMLSSPKTTIGGILVAIGTALISVSPGGDLGWLHYIGQILTGIGSLMLGISAKDHA